MKTKVYKSYEDFLKREDKNTNGVSEDFAAEHPDFEEQNRTNYGCWNCSHCSFCDSCVYCKNCDNCINCSFCDSCVSCKNCYYYNHCSFWNTLINKQTKKQKNKKHENKNF